MLHIPEQQTAVLRERVPMAALTEFFGRAFAAVAAETEAQNVQLAGPPFALYRGTPTQTIDVEAGFPIAGTGNVVTSTLPEVDAFETIHAGAYDTLNRTYAALQEQIKAAGRTPLDTMWEYYLTGPSTEADPLKWQTRIV
ncbi:GyrI-like domain-containing protein [Arthrobacter sp. Bi83]|uniref:GyrI-like domain-containing protein n=1 Tax=Arthrobacter sp. Bi83 TaxID=2822353 RepID=UPI001E48989A|nr:GyrI-like domain-containing protein [Arthrobacter sp. Bi83]